MSMMSLLKRLFRAAGEAYLDEKLPASKPQQSASGSRKKPAAKKPASAARKPASQSARRKTGTASHSAKVYSDQSILANPAGMFTPVPQQLRQMRTLSGYNNLDGTRSMESLFYQQGKFMEQYTDDYHEPVQCGRAVPMYYNMKDHELRAYFTWRTLYRQGALPQTQNAFLLLYAYEILNLIGFSSAESAYDALGNLLRDYGEQFPSVKKSLLRWMPDFAAYYHLPYRLEDEKEAAEITVLRHSSHSAEELLLALDTLSKYHIKDSKLYLAEKEKVSELLKAVYQAMLMHYAEQKNQSFSAYLLGEQSRAEHLMFEGAVFCHRSIQADGSYRLSPLCVYHCCKGKWAKETFCSKPHTDRVGALLRTFDAMLREKLNFKGKLKSGELPEGDAEIIRKAIDDWFAEQARKNAPVITLNEAELAEIRKAAEHTTDMLTLPEDEITEAAAPVPEPAAPDEDDEPDDSEIPDLPLSAPAMALLICLATGESYQPLVDAGQMLSVLADEINENLYDSFGDTIIEMQDDGTPVLIEDYLDDVKGMLET
ncbi:MAG: TerB N-terminal domain-containing protein [Oscillospiraceae bacterium]|nr:TerB N-terminal domain-containing protein [Oscillospiraceae bacterium]